MYLLIQKGWALQAIPSQGAKEKNFRECAERLGWEPPSRGRRPIYNPERVKDFYETAKNTLPHKTRDEKWVLVEMVMKQFGFPSKEAAYQYLKELGIKGLPWRD